MRKVLLLAVIGIAWFSLGLNPCVAQETVHALTGTVSAINPAAHTITVKTDDGSEGLFKTVEEHGKKTELNKWIETEATSADQFTKIGSRVIVYYVGDGDVRTAVAVKDRGNAAVQQCSGTVAAIEHHHHLLAMKDDKGGTQEFVINEQTVADTGGGAAEGLKYEANKGDHVKVVWTSANGQNTALFIYAVE